MVYSKSRHGDNAVADMKLNSSDSKKVASLCHMDPGLAVAEFFHPVLEKMVAQPPSSSSSKKSSSTSATSASSATSATAGATPAEAPAPQITALFKPVPTPGSSDWLAEREERGQNLSSFMRGQFRARCHGNFNTIALVILGKSMCAELLGNLKKYVEAFFVCQVEILQVDLEKEDPKHTKFPFRDSPYGELERQYLISPLMQRCSDAVNSNRNLSRRTVCTLGITLFDIYPGENYNFVYGQASLESGKGVFSLSRFHPQWEGRAHLTEQEASSIIFKRACKVATHECMHMFGLRHCINHGGCLINGANHVDELNKQGLVECPCCTKKLLCSFGWDLHKRYQGLVAVCQEFGFLVEAELWMKLSKIVEDEMMVPASSASTSSSATATTAASSTTTPSSSSSSFAYKAHPPKAMGTLYK